MMRGAGEAFVLAALLVPLLVTVATMGGIGADAAVCGVSTTPRNLQGKACGALAFNMSFCSGVRDETRVCANVTQIPELESGAEHLFQLFTSDPTIPGARSDACHAALRRMLCLFRFPACVPYDPSLGSFANLETRRWCWSACMATADACYSDSAHSLVTQWCQTGVQQQFVAPDGASECVGGGASALVAPLATVLALVVTASAVILAA